MEPGGGATGPVTAVAEPKHQKLVLSMQLLSSCYKTKLLLLSHDLSSNSFF